MKIKTFSFEDNSVFRYNKDYTEEWCSKSIGEYSYISNVSLIDETINNFINNSNIEIIDIKINNIIKGNNPPTSILIYTIIYKENK